MITLTDKGAEKVQEFLAAQAYCLNGDHLAGALGIQKPNLFFQTLVWLQCLLFMFLSFSYPWLPRRYQQHRDEVSKHP